MKNRDNKTPRKTHDVNSKLEEENLWDLEDDWDDADNETSEEDQNASASDSTDEESGSTDEASDSTDEDTSPTPDSSDEATVEAAEEADDTSHTKDDDEIEATDQDELEPKTPDEPEADANTPSEIETNDSDADSANESPENSDKQDSPEGIKSEIGALISPLKKFSLSSTEKITLVSLAVVFAGLAIWGYVFLYERNNLAETESTQSLPAKGQYATIDKLSTYWISAGEAAGIKLGVAVVPAASISLDDASTSGALRIFFRDAGKNSVGDPITISFQDGKFIDSNKTNITMTDNGTTATVSATNGFQIEGDFNAYQMDTRLAWKVHVLEAESSASDGSDFKEFFVAKVAPKRK